MNEEIWKPIPGYGGHYEASSEGRIRVLDRVIVKKHPMTGRMCENRYKGRLLTPCKSGKYGYMGVTLGVDGVDYSVSVHKLVLLAFVGEKPVGFEVCHNNGIAWDNRASNLRWDTHFNNNQDRLRHGTYARGEEHHMCRLSEEQVIEIFQQQPSLKDCIVRYGISRSQAFRIKKGKSWEHVHGDKSRMRARKLSELDMLADTIERLA